MQTSRRQRLVAFLMPAMLAISLLPLGAAQAQDGSGNNQTLDFPNPRAVSVKITTTATSSTALNSTFDYLIEVSNSGNQTVTAALTDVLPATTQIVGTPALTVITPTVTPSTATFDPAISPQGAVRWDGTLSAGAKMQIKFTVTLIACPAKNDDDDRDRFSALGDWDRGVINTVMLKTGSGISVASVAFTPAGCKTDQPNPRPTPPTTAGADVTVRKYALLSPNWERPERGWQGTWLVLYGNRGSETANDVTLTDTPIGNPSPELVRSLPALTPTVQGGSLVFNIGALPSLRGGALLFRTPLSYTTPGGTVLTNTVSITASNDVSATNNTSVVSVTTPFLPPVITYPPNGATFSGTLTVTGLAQAGAQVGISVDQMNVVSTTANSNGEWSANVFLEDGVHVLRATMTVGNVSRRSQPVVLKVNSALLWDPISLTFVGPDGVQRHPKHYTGWFDQAGWYVTLAPSTTYTSSVRICCSAATVTMTIPGTGAVTFSDPDGDKTFTASFTTGDAKSMRTGVASLCVDVDGKRECGIGRIVPLLSSKGRRIVVLTKDGFDPPSVRLNRDEGIEIVNMDDVPRAFGPSPNMNAMSADAGAANDDGIYLNSGESQVLDITSATTLVDAQNSNQTLTVDFGAGTYLPVIIR